jgi:hypothetical protein
MFDYKMPTLPPVAEPVWFYPPAVKKTKKVNITKSDTAVKFVVPFTSNPVADITISYELEPFTVVVREYSYSDELYHTTVTKISLPIEGEVSTSDSITTTVKNGVVTVVVPHSSIK